MKAILLLTATLSLFGQPDRIAVPIDAQSTVVLKQGINPRVQYAQDLGPMPESQIISRIRLAIEMTDAQKDDERKYVTEVGDPASQNYRKQLSPDEYGRRFGLSAHDRSSITAWLEKMRFHIDEDPNELLDAMLHAHYIRFSGTAAQVRIAFHSEVHLFKACCGNVVGTFPNTTSPSVPAALENVVSWIDGLNDFPITGVY